MPTLQEADARRADLQDLSTLAIGGVTDLVRQLEFEDPTLIRQVLAEYMPSLVDPYAAAAGELAIDSYMVDRSAAGVVTKYPGRLAAVLPTLGRYAALANWATVILLANPELTMKVADRVAGGVSKIVFNAQRDTTLEMLEDDSEPGRYQRMTSPGCCDFCALLASRGAVYWTEESAKHVIGRGVPVDAVYRSDGSRKRGGRPGGIRARSNSPFGRMLGEDFHDHCKCTVVALHKGREQQMHKAADDWFDVFAEARDRTYESLPQTIVSVPYKRADGSTKYKHHWEDPLLNIVTSRDNTNEILRHMAHVRAGK